MASQLDHWCMGSWFDVDPGLNSEEDDGKHFFAEVRREQAIDASVPRAAVDPVKACAAPSRAEAVPTRSVAVHSQ